MLNTTCCLRVRAHAHASCACGLFNFFFNIFLVTYTYTWPKIFEKKISKKNFFLKKYYSLKVEKRTICNKPYYYYSGPICYQKNFQPKIFFFIFQHAGTAHATRSVCVACDTHTHLNTPCARRSACCNTGIDCLLDTSLWSSKSWDSEFRDVMLYVFLYFK